MLKLFAFLNAIASLSPELEQHLHCIVKRQTYNRKEYIQTQGQICQQVRFLESGLIRIYQEINKREVTIWLLQENDVVISVKSFFERIPAKDKIEAMEKSVLWSITRNELEETCRLFPEFLVHQDRIKNKYYQISTDREAVVKGLPARERYDWLFQKDAELVERVPLEHIASYLGFSKDVVSQIRHDKARGK